LHIGMACPTFSIKSSDGSDRKSQQKCKDGSTWAQPLRV
jgi:hypothetical protein